MSWREAFLTRFGPGGLGGVTFGDWWRVLRENRFAVDAPYLGRAASITFGSFSNTFFRALENLVYKKQLQEAEIAPPIFILGVWRSGTTFLHYLMTRDERFAFPNNYQVLNPHTFLTTEAVNSRLLAPFLPPTRPQDNIRWKIPDPQEEEFALTCMSGRTVMMSFVFPKHEERFHPYLSLRDIPEAERQRWKSALVWFLKKVSSKYRRPLVLKSPANTARIKILLELFPQAKFIHIRRNPYVVFQSWMHTTHKVLLWWTLQRPERIDLEERIFRQYRDLYAAYFEERSLIPPGNLYEVAFEELEADPVGQLRRIYQGLSLPDFETVEPALRKYVDSVAGYQKNVFSELPPETRNRIATEWRRCFEEWGYAV